MTTETPPDEVLIEAAKRCAMFTKHIDALRYRHTGDSCFRALCDMIQQHEAFKQEVSDTVESITNTAVDPVVWRKWVCDRLSVFIITEPDPLVDRKRLCAREAMKSWVGGGAGPETICVRAIELYEEGFGK